MKARDRGAATAAVLAGVLPYRVRDALMEIRRGLIEELQADELDGRARVLRRRGQLRQVRALERLTGVAPFDVKAGAVDHG